jgi:hypothetical protein
MEGLPLNSLEESGLVLNLVNKRQHIFQWYIPGDIMGGRKNIPSRLP